MPFFYIFPTLMRLFRTILPLIGWLLTFLPGISQVVTTDPPFPQAGQAVTIFFDATAGNGGLAGYTGDVYAHTGVLTSGSTSGTDWKYVKTGWGENTPETKLVRIGQDRYSLEIIPSILTYYGVPEGETITHLAFVFRSSDSQREGKQENGEDIFAAVYPDGLQVRIQLPEAEVPIVAVGQYLAFQAVSNLADTLALFVDGELVKEVAGERELSHVLPTAETGNHRVVIRATDENETAADSMFYVVRGEPLAEALPEGIADGINYRSDTTVILSLYAPSREHVFVIGDFTGWVPDENYFMKQTPGGERFWIEINQLEPGKIYRFYYLVDGNLKIADPYTELLVDPGADRFISESTFPGITALRKDLDDGHYGVIETNRDPYPWKSNSYEPPDPEDLIIYELLLRDFLEAHDWKTLTDTLDYLEKLGVNAIELMPFNEFNGNESWGYNPTYFLAPDKYYGPAEDLKAFIDECHARGMAVIQDIVFNHVEKWSPFAELYLDQQGYPSEDNPWLNADVDLNDPKGYYQACHPYNVFFDFDHSSIHTQQLVDRTTRYWMEEYRIDGFRFDLTKGFTQKNTYLGTDQNGNARYDEGMAAAYDAQRVGFLKRMADTIWAFCPEAYVILEHFCDNTEEKELADHGMMLWGNINHNYNEATMGYNESGKSNFSWISYKTRGWNDPNLVGYMESHDEERLMVKNLLYGNSEGDYNIQELSTSLERMQLAGAFFFTIPGPKMIWQFGEVGYDYSINYDCRVCNKPIRWDYFKDPDRRRLYEVWSSLIRLRTGTSAFRSDDFDLYVSGSWKRIEINDPSMDIRIIGNFDVVTQPVDPSFSTTGTWYDYFSGDQVEISDPHQQVLLKPGQFHLFTSRQVALPPPSVTHPAPVFISESSDFLPYPNPAADWVQVDPLPAESRYTFTDLQGRNVLELSLGPWEGELDLSLLSNGVFIVRRSIDGEEPVFTKLIRVSLR